MDRRRQTRRIKNERNGIVWNLDLLFSFESVFFVAVKALHPMDPHLIQLSHSQLTIRRMLVRFLLG